MAAFSSTLLRRTVVSASVFRRASRPLTARPLSLSQNLSSRSDAPLQRPLLQEEIDELRREEEARIIEERGGKSEKKGWKSLSPAVISVLRNQNVLEPTQIQSGSWQALCNGGSALLGAVTGSGKTLAFLLPLLKRTEDRQWPPFHTLVLCPTRELALQTYLQAERLMRPLLGPKTDAALHLLSHGLEGEHDQLTRLQRERPSLMIATPKRALEMLEHCAIADEIRAVVIDEADRLLDPPGKNPRKRKLRRRHPKPTAEILDRIIYLRQFELDEPRGPYRASRRKDVQLVAVSASIGAAVRKELHDCGWAEKPARVTQMPQGRDSLPDTLTHYVASPFYRGVFQPEAGETGRAYRHNSKRELTVAEQEEMEEQSENMLAVEEAVMAQATRLLRQVYDVLFRSGAATAIVFVPTGVPLHDVRDMLLGRRRAGTREYEDERGDATPSRLQVSVLYDHVHRRTPAEAAEARDELLQKLSAASPASPMVVVASMDASRGVDLPNVELAVLVGTPRTRTDYVHLAGRVGRAGVQGKVVTVAYDQHQTERIARFGRQLAVNFAPFEALYAEHEEPERME